MDKQQAITNMKQGKNIPYKHETIATLITMADKLEKIEQIVEQYQFYKFEGFIKIKEVLEQE